MTRIFFNSLWIAVLFNPWAMSWSEMTPSKMGSSLAPSSGIKSIELLDKKQSSSFKPAPKATPLPAAKSAPQVAQHAEYLHPGILVYLNGKWEGSDHLLNISRQIGVYVTIVKPEEEALQISQEQLQAEVEEIFGKANIQPLTMVAQGKPPLPAFEVEIFVYPIEKGYAACCNGRLFESVILERFKMDSQMAFQAITWEKQTLLVGPKSTFSEQLTKTVQDIATAFVERFQAYEKIKSEAFR